MKACENQRRHSSIEMRLCNVSSNGRCLFKAGLKTPLSSDYGRRDTTRPATMDFIMTGALAQSTQEEQALSWCICELIVLVAE